MIQDKVPAGQRLSKRLSIHKFKIQYKIRKLLYTFHKRWPAIERIHFFSFPAVKLKKPDKIDYLLSFSSDFILIAFVFSVGLLNFYFLSFNTDSSDNSLAGQILKENHAYNEKVYAHIASIRTVVDSDRSLLLPEAHAESSPFLTADTINNQEDSTEDLVVSEGDSMVRPNPDSVQSLINKQIKVHPVKQGETLASIAKEYGLKTNTIKWANSLQSDTVKPDWKLLIPPIDGVVIKAGRQTTLPDIAHKYKCDIDKIIAYNGLANAEDIEADQIIIAPGCSVQTVAPAPITPKTKTTIPTIKDKLIPGSHLFPWGYCTWYVATKTQVEWGGNAANWDENAAALGHRLTKTPAPGFIAQTAEGGRQGHVAFVEQVNHDGSIVISEMNYKGKGIKSTRTLPANSPVIITFIVP